MVHWTARVVTIRTTRDGTGRAYDVVMGLGATPELAMAALRIEAEKAAQRAVEGTSAAKKAMSAADQRAGIAFGEPMPQPQSGTRFEVVDVRFTPSSMEGGGSGWLAYGTLASDPNPRVERCRLSTTE